MKRLGVDVGGTFTDLIYVDDEAGRILVHKTATTPDDPSQGTVEGIRELTTPDDVKKAVPCGPDAERVADSIREYVEVGFDELYVSQMGPDQEGMIRFYEREVLPRLR